MARTRCVTPGCPGDASQQCELPVGLKKCGNCCSCPGHGRRSTRGGQHSGRRSLDGQLHRGNMFVAYKVLQEAAQFLMTHCVGELQAFGYNTPTAIRQALYRAARVVLLPHSVAGLDRRGADLLQVLPFLLQQRLLFGCGPDLARGVDHPAQPRQATGGASSSSTAAPRSVVAPRPVTASEESRPVSRRRVEALETEHADQSQALHVPSPDRAQRVARSTGLTMQVQLEGLSGNIVRECVEATVSFAVLPAPQNEPPQELRLVPGGHFLWDTVKDCPSGACCRVSEPFPVTWLQGSTYSSLEAWARAGGSFCLHDRALGAATFSDNLQQWIAARANLRQRFGPLRNLRPPWAHQVMAGGWLYAPVAEDTPTTGQDLIGYHGSSMHVLERVARRGLENGWSGLVRDGREHLGIYFHEAHRGRLCHNYVLYSALDSTGFLVAPVICLRAPRPDPYYRKEMLRTSGQPQNLTYEDVCSIRGIFLHVIHTLQFWGDPASNRVLAEPRFCYSLELDPNETREQLQARSRLASVQNS